ncbi:MAG: tRNA (adenosine(37)-N6)-threonylcarbamoyltransferase complex dimerization subunit type 1 TsaB [Dehalococcoidia bacterium]|jgi:tRNA threonylcarbamoyladenosine biosynthesis protein TsaB
MNVPTENNILLAIDSTESPFSFALFHNNIQNTYSEWTAQSLSMELLDQLRKFLNKSKIDINAIDRYAICNGPGGYSSLRVAVASFKGITTALNKKIIGISKLSATAYEVLSDNNTSFPNVISFHKIRENFYIWSLYNKETVMQIDTSNKLNDFNEQSILEFPNQVTFCGDIPPSLQELITTSKHKLTDYNINNVTTKNASTIGALALMRNQFVDSKQLDVFYPLPPSIHKKK